MVINTKFPTRYILTTPDENQVEFEIRENILSLHIRRKGERELIYKLSEEHTWTLIRHLQRNYNGKIDESIIGHFETIK
jgi:hypothetical protein